MEYSDFSFIVLCVQRRPHLFWYFTRSHSHAATNSYSSDSHLPTALGTAVQICSGLNKHHCMTPHILLSTSLIPPLFYLCHLTNVWHHQCILSIFAAHKNVRFSLCVPFSAFRLYLFMQYILIWWLIITFYILSVMLRSVFCRFLHAEKAYALQQEGWVPAMLTCQQIYVLRHK